MSHTEISNTVVRKQAKLYQKPVHVVRIQLFRYSMHLSQPQWMGTLRAVPRPNEWVCGCTPGETDDPQWSQPHKWDIGTSQWSVGILKKEEKGSAGAHVTGALCKGTLVYPLHLLQEQRWFSLLTFTASQWTRLVFPLDMTHTVDAARSLFAEQRGSAENWSLSRVSRKKWLQEHFYIKHPLPIMRC